MFKLRTKLENVAEKLVGKWLPEVEARAGCDYANTYQCCDAQHQRAYYHKYCDGVFVGTVCLSSPTCWA